MPSGHEIRQLNSALGAQAAGEVMRYCTDGLQALVETYDIGCEILSFLRNSKI